MRKGSASLYFRIVLVVYFMQIISSIAGSEAPVNSLLTISPKHPINVTEGDRLQVECRVNKRITSQQSLYWKARGRVKASIHQEWVGGYEVRMMFPTVDRSDAGLYQCIYNTTQGQHTRGVFIKVNLKGGHSDVVCNKNSEHFCMGSHLCIPKGQDCEDPSIFLLTKATKTKCLPLKFQCQNDHCIDHSLVCDSQHNNDCGDWSDEYCLMVQEPLFGVTSAINLTEAPPTENDDTAHLTWLKTTVYAVIGCTVSVVLLISLIVIAVFRVRMKQSVYRHTERALHRRNVSSRHRHSRRCSELENDPFLNMSPGSIIVNVNNGVQYIPGNEFTSLVRAPPSYSEIDDSGAAGHRESPPPSYSTIDRNPVRGVINFDDYVIHESSLTTACAPCLPTLSRDSSIISDSESYIQFQLGPAPHTQNASVQTSHPAATNSAQHTPQHSTGTCASPIHQQAQSRQPILVVQHGQIVLSGCAEESRSQGSTTQERNISASPAHLRVEAGHIVLGGNSTADVHVNTSQELVEENQENSTIHENSESQSNCAENNFLKNKTENIPVEIANEVPLVENGAEVVAMETNAQRLSVEMDTSDSHVSEVSISEEEEGRGCEILDEHVPNDEHQIFDLVHDNTISDGGANLNSNSPELKAQNCESESSRQTEVSPATIPGVARSKSLSQESLHDDITAEQNSRGIIDIQNGILVIK